MSQAEMVLRHCRTVFLAATLLWSVGAAAQPEVAGAKDFPLIKRYEGSRLIGYDSRSFDTVKLLLGKLKLGDNGQPAVDAVREVEGRHTRLLYLAPPERSALEVFRNYEADLAAKGFAVLYKCSGEEACESFGAEIYRILYPPTGALQNNELSKVAFNVPAEPHYLAATLARPEGQVSVSLYVAVDRGNAFPETKDRVAVLLDVVEDKPMEAKMVTVDAATMAKAAGYNVDQPNQFALKNAELSQQSALAHLSADTQLAAQKMSTTSQQLISQQHDANSVLIQSNDSAKAAYGNYVAAVAQIDQNDKMNEAAKRNAIVTQTQIFNNAIAGMKTATPGTADVASPLDIGKMATEAANMVGGVDVSNLLRGISL